VVVVEAASIYFFLRLDEIVCNCLQLKIGSLLSKSGKIMKNLQKFEIKTDVSLLSAQYRNFPTIENHFNFSFCCV